MTVGNTQSQRLLSLDALRGVALFGILFVNLFSFGADSIAWTTSADRSVWLIKHILFESKFWGLYSVLFGISFHLFMQSSRFSYFALGRRLAVLFLFGVVHALIFEGDILMLYAELAVLLWLVHRLPSGVLLALIAGLCVSFPLGHYFHSDRDADPQPESIIEAKHWLTEDQADDIHVNGTLGEIIQSHASYLPERFWADYQYPDSGFLVLGFFLIGYLFARRGALRQIHGSFVHQPGFAAGCWLLGVALMAIEQTALHASGYSAFSESLAGPAVTLLGDVVYVTATLLLTAAWFLTVQICVDRQVFPGGLELLARAGRMSLTLYLMQTLIFTTIFYGYGLGKAYQLGPLQVLLLAIGIYAAQLIFASLWLRWFRIGPLEWIWRMGTHARPEPIRRDEDKG